METMLGTLEVTEQLLTIMVLAVLPLVCKCTRFGVRNSMVRKTLPAI